MVCPEQTNWFFDYELIDDMSVPDRNFSAQASGFTWSTQDLNGSAAVVGVKIGSSLGDSDGHKEVSTKKRARLESSSSVLPSSKACREKQRRDKLNDKFMELGAILESGKPPKTDKGAILMDAVRIVTQLKGEARKLKDTNSSLQEKIKELKVEKIELRDEKQRLKLEKERLEQQVKSSNFMAQPTTAMPAMFGAHQGQVVGNKMVPVMSYPTVAMWQFMPSSAVDTSRDHVLHPPVA
ncbi:transcription factor ILR3 [Impatiens glandulifera]|uniref:transcription factor ILR3 n=1 Tax=Impatiens glandulifera TaxID=253017 RepID=UPI001FB17B19|nr:transcription factor ILR3 [Impatiens glandulifera]